MNIFFGMYIACRKAKYINFIKWSKVFFFCEYINIKMYHNILTNIYHHSYNLHTYSHLKHVVYKIFKRIQGFIFRSQRKYRTGLNKAHWCCTKFLSLGYTQLYRYETFLIWIFFDFKRIQGYIFGSQWKRRTCLNKVHWCCVKLLFLGVKVSNLEKVVLRSSYLN